MPLEVFSRQSNPHPHLTIRLPAWYNVGMLTGKEKLYVYALWKRRVASGQYLSDILPGNLRTEELMDLIPSALYAKELVEAEYGENTRIGPYEKRRDEFLQPLISKHQANIQRLTQ